jgi:cholest-4-en-3-one 26-monooxygenase
MVGLTQDEAVDARRLSMAAFDSIEGADFPQHMASFTAFMDAQLEQRKTAAGDDYLTALAQGEIDVKPVDARFVTGIMVSFMLGGHHSTATAIARLFRHVLPDRTLREQVMTDDRLLTRVIEARSSRPASPADDDGSQLATRHLHA